MSSPKLARYDRFGYLHPYLLREPQCGQFYRCSLQAYVKYTFVS